jgi:hypothetical protein
VEESAEPVSSSDVDAVWLIDLGWLGPGFWASEVEGLVGTLAVVVVDVGAQHTVELSAAGD